MNKKNKNRVWGQIILIMVIGLVISYITGDFRPGEIIGDTETLEPEALFTALSAILAVAALLLGAGYIVYRAVRGKDKAVWTEWDEDRES